MAVKNIPKTETVWEHLINFNGREYIVTSNKNRDKYFLYDITEKSNYVKIGHAATPVDLLDKYLDFDFMEDNDE